MLPIEFRSSLRNFIGEIRYIEFVLSFFNEIPPREKFLFWQEKILSDFHEQTGAQFLKIADIYSVFDHCQIHDIRLKPGFCI